VARRRLPLIAALTALAVAPATAVAGAKTVRLDVPDGTTAAFSVTVDPATAPSFRVRLRTPTSSRARLFLSGRTAPRSTEPLIDTRTAGCQGAAGSRYCEASYERLPRGRYTWTVRVRAPFAGSVTLTVRW
jgi:hypothetical protein